VNDFGGRNVERMRAQGGLEVVQEEDARVHPFRLTPQGSRLIEKAVPAWEEAQHQAVELLGDEGIALLNKAAKKLAELRPWLSGQTVQQALPQRAEEIVTGNGLAGVRETAIAPLRH
jgi:hypothetical protein